MYSRIFLRGYRFRFPVLYIYFIWYLNFYLSNFCIKVMLIKLNSSTTFLSHMVFLLTISIVISTNLVFIIGVLITSCLIVFVWVFSFEFLLYMERKVFLAYVVVSFFFVLLMLINNSIFKLLGLVWCGWNPTFTYLDFPFFILVIFLELFLILFLVGF